MPGANPPSRRALLARASGVGSATTSPRRSRPARGGVLRHQVPGAIGVGAKSPARAIVAGNAGHRLARPLTLSTSGGCPEEGRRLPESSMAVVPTADSADQDVRVVRSRARGDIHLQNSQGSARPRFAPRKRREGRSSRCLRTPVNTRSDCSGRPAGAARRDGSRESARSEPMRWKASGSRRIAAWH
jgi:hypothetical protein